MNGQHDLLRIMNKKLDALLSLQGLTLAELKSFEASDAEIEALVARLKTSADALKAATDANQPSPK